MSSTPTRTYVCVVSCLDIKSSFLSINNQLHQHNTPGVRPDSFPAKGLSTAIRLGDGQVVDDTCTQFLQLAQYDRVCRPPLNIFFMLVGATAYCGYRGV